MSDGRGFLGGFFGNDEILWFIILFLLLFFCNGIGNNECCNVGC